VHEKEFVNYQGEFMDIQIATVKEINIISEVFGATNFDYEDGALNYEYNGILDVYDRCLNEEEAKILLSSFANHNLKHEKKFFEFFNLLTAGNDLSTNPIFVKLRYGFNYPFKTRGDKFRLNAIFNG
jgi:hypothetical protein